MKLTSHHKYRFRHPRSREKAPAQQWIARWLLVGMLALMPLAFGGVQAWSFFVVVLACAGLLACLLTHAWRNRDAGGLLWVPAYMPLVLFIAIALLQALPVPFGVLQWLSPQAANLYGELREDIAGSFTFSLYPRATWQDLCVVVCAATIFMTVVTFVRHSSQIKRLLLAVGLIGAFFALLALAQDLLGNGRFYWIGPAEVQPRSGTFACHNHFSQHMVLSVMAMLAYSMIRIREVVGRSWLDRESFSEWLTSPELRGVRWLLLFSVLGLASVAISASRMGTVSAVVAMVVMTILYGARRGTRNANVPMIVGIIAFAAIVLGGFEMVFERMSTLKDFDAYANRWTVVKDVLPAIGDFPLVGSGLGTFSVVYPMYDTGSTWRFASHAENEYAQLLLEMGFLGGGLVLWFLISVGRSAISVMARAKRSPYVAGPPLVAGLVAVMLHSWTDFGQHLPAIAALSAVFCGLLVVMGHRAGTSRRRRRPTAEEALRDGKGTKVTARRQIYVNACLGVMAMILVLNIPAGFLHVFAEEYDSAALQLSERLQRAKWQGTDADFTTLVALGERTVQLDPGNVFYRYRLGVYRWWAVVRDRSASDLKERYTNEVVDTAGLIVDEMISASGSCPTMGSIHSWRGQLEWWVLGNASGRDRVEKAARLARNDRVTLHAAGVLAAVDKDPEVAYERFRRSIEVRGSLAAAAEVLLDELKRPDLVLALAGQDPLRLHEMSSLLAQKGYPGEAEAAADLSLEAYGQRIDDPATPGWAIAMLAAAAAENGNYTQAVSLYRRCLAKEYTQLQWRTAQVRCLISAGDFAEAQRETDVLHRLNAKQELVEALRSEIAKAQRTAATQATTQPAAQRLPQ